MATKTTLVFACASVLLASCSVRLWVSVINNTNDNVELFSDDQHVTVAKNSVGSVYYGEIAIRRGLCRYIYVLPTGIDIPGYRKDGGSPETIVVLQLEQDGKLYLLPPKTSSSIDIVNRDRLAQGPFPVMPSAHRCDG
jgi:hypothetical protein